jgi:hypothetical protein
MSIMNREILTRGSPKTSTAADASLISFSDRGSGSPVIPPPAESGGGSTGSSSGTTDGLK